MTKSSNATSRLLLCVCLELVGPLLVWCMRRALVRMRTPLQFMGRRRCHCRCSCRAWPSGPSSRTSLTAVSHSAFVGLEPDRFQSSFFVPIGCLTPNVPAVWLSPEMHWVHKNTMVLCSPRGYVVAWSNAHARRRAQVVYIS